MINCLAALCIIGPKISEFKQSMRIFIFILVLYLYEIFEYWYLKVIIHALSQEYETATKQPHLCYLVSFRDKKNSAGKFVEEKHFFINDWICFKNTNHIKLIQV